MKTIKTYSEAIRNKYLRDKEAGVIRGEIYKLTPGNIRKLCLNLINSELSIEDKIILKNVFESDNFDTIRKKIKTYDIDKLKPICKFLKRENDSIASHEALELIALFIDFTPRPYSKYINTSSNEEEIRSPTDDDDERKVIYTNLEGVKPSIVVKPKNKKFFMWISTVSAFNKWKIIIYGIFFFITITASTFYLLNNKTRWMVWQETEYIEVRFDTKKYAIDQLKLYKAERIKYFKKVNVDCNTAFFNPDGNVKIWYGKNDKKELEFFTALGLHPETGKTLKPITEYMIKKYVCPDYSRTNNNNPK